MFVLSQERRRAVSMVTGNSGTPLLAVWRETQRSNPTPGSNSYARDASGRQVFCMMQSVKDCYDPWHNDIAQWYWSMPTVRNCKDTVYKIIKDRAHQLNMFLIQAMKCQSFLAASVLFTHQKLLILWPQIFTADILFMLFAERSCSNILKIWLLKNLFTY